MTRLNAVGDVILEDPRAMLALAVPARLTLHAALRRHGPATVDELAALLGDEPRATAAHLEALEEVGLVVREHATWTVVGKGIFFEIPEDPEGQSAGRQLSNAMLLQYADLPRRWVSADEPRLPVEWARAAGMFNARLFVTPDELAQIQEGLESLLEGYLTREPSAAPTGAAHVRLLAYFMPEAESGPSPPG